MNVFTNCNSCIFFDKEDPCCTLGKWEHPKFVDNLVKEEDEWHILNRICPFHRTSGWQELQGDGNLQETVNNEVKLKFGYVQVITDDTSGKMALEEIKSLCETKYPPQSIYLLDYRTNNSDQQYYIDFLNSINKRFYIKQILEEGPPAFYIDQLAQTKKIKDPFYIFSNNVGLNRRFFDGLNVLLYKDLEQVLFAGNEKDLYFTSTMLHQIRRAGFADYLTKENSGHTVFTMEQVTQKGEENWCG